MVCECALKFLKAAFKIGLMWEGFNLLLWVLEDGVSWGQRGKGEINFNAITVLVIICLFIYSEIFTVKSTSKPSSVVTLETLKNTLLHTARSNTNRDLLRSKRYFSAFGEEPKKTDTSNSSRKRSIKTNSPGIKSNKIKKGKQWRLKLRGCWLPQHLVTRQENYMHMILRGLDRIH